MERLKERERSPTKEEESIEECCWWKKYTTPTGPAAGVSAEVVTLICAYWPMLIIV